MIYFIGIVGIVMLALGGFGAWQKHRADAADERADALDAQLELCAASNATLTDKLRGLQSDADAFRSEASRQQAKSAKELAEAAKQRAADEAQVARLAAIINRPPSTDGDACARADRILRGLIDGVQ